MKCQCGLDGRQTIVTWCTYYIRNCPKYIYVLYI
ncbi:hypothetical protein PHET_09333 [Paragonimus heterotremus]|uniref:Uncharacterized protein n=1 Tax=Paragonimus heterotremus TaxID=100268 RepID=A0A8J4WSP8_9TREM|nr:hypothetical protein PHET_09333 [Paragonimus heterotremus]